MPLSKLQFRPGVNQEITSYSNEGGWRDCDKIRFRFGYPEKIGGWEKYTSSTYLGSARALHNWIALDGSNYLGIGTHLKYYIEEGQGMNDITPIRATTAAGDVTFAATNGSTTITVSDTSHGAFENDFVTFSGAASLGGAITADRSEQRISGCARYRTRTATRSQAQLQPTLPTAAMAAPAPLALIRSTPASTPLLAAQVGAQVHMAVTAGAMQHPAACPQPTRFVCGRTTTSVKI